MVGVEGHNPSGHCLIASNIIDHAPLSVANSEQNPPKRRALGHNLSSQNTRQVSLVCNFRAMNERK